jgi:hypothetical protein
LQEIKIDLVDKNFNSFPDFALFLIWFEIIVPEAEITMFPGACKLKTEGLFLENAVQ